MLMMLARLASPWKGAAAHSGDAGFVLANQPATDAHDAGTFSGIPRELTCMMLARLPLSCVGS